MPTASIRVNGVTAVVSGKVSLSYDEVIALAAGGLSSARHTVVFRVDRWACQMQPGDVVVARDGMHFTVSKNGAALSIAKRGDE